VSTKIFTLLIGFAYRQARRSGLKIWWLVVVVAWLLRRVDSRVPLVRGFKLRDGGAVDIRVKSPAPTPR
jgi:hypothetical protein